MENNHGIRIPITPEEWDMGTSKSSTMEKANQVKMGIQEHFWYWCVSSEV